MEKWKKPKKGDLIWYFGKLMYFESSYNSNYQFSVPSSNTKSRYATKNINFRDLIKYGNY